MNVLEYYSSQKKRVRSVFQCVCECNELDECFTEIFQGRFPDNNRIRRLLDDVQDRLRIPWLGGAKKADPDMAYVAATIGLIFMGWNWGWFESCWGILSFIIVLFGQLGFTHLIILKIKSRSRFPVHWLALSTLVLYYDAEMTLGIHMERTEIIFARLAFAVCIVAFAKCTQPAPVPLEQSSNLLSLAEDQHCFAEFLWCSICKAHVHGRDHHCVWIGACVGSGNQVYFCVFCGSFSVLAVWYGCQKLTQIDFGSTIKNEGKGVSLFIPFWEGISNLVTCAWTNHGCFSLFLSLYALVGSLLSGMMSLHQVFCILTNRWKLKQ